jgi:hypothetical protein
MRNSSRREVGTALRVARVIRREGCLLALVAAFASASPAFGQRTWTNSQADNNFATLSNWTPVPTGFSGTNLVWNVNETGTNRAIVSSVVGNVQRDLFVGGTDAGVQGELVVGTGGSLTVTRTLELRRGSLDLSGNGVVTVTGNADVATISGTITIADTAGLSGGNNVRLANADNSVGILSISSGTVTAASTLGFAQGNASQATVGIDGGVLSAVGNVRIASGTSSQASVTMNGGELTAGMDVFLAAVDGAQVALTMTGGTIAGASIRVAFGAGSQATMNISGGSINAPDNFITFGQAAGSTVNVVMSGGSITGDRIAWGNEPTASATLTMTGGTINVVRTGTNTSSGAFSMQSGNPSLNISGSAVVNTEKLNINNGGLLTLGGDAIMNVTGSTDGLPTFDFASALNSGTWSSVSGTIDFSSLTSLLQVTGTGETVTIGQTSFSYNYANLFNQAIANGVITRSVGAGFLVGYDAGSDLTTVSVVPEPSTLAVLGGVVVLLGVGWRRRRK